MCIRFPIIKVLLDHLSNQIVIFCTLIWIWKEIKATQTRCGESTDPSGCEETVIKAAPPASPTLWPTVNENKTFYLTITYQHHRQIQQKKKSSQKNRIIILKSQFQPVNEQLFSFKWTWRIFSLQEDLLGVLRLCCRHRTFTMQLVSNCEDGPLA